VRRTKDDAAQTRVSIILAAAEMFHRHGVAGTSMEHVAAAAGITRGAIYWHFRNKTELFIAVREQEKLPLINFMDLESQHSTSDDPLLDLERALTGIIDRLAASAFLKQVHQIIAFRCEYVDELLPAFEHIYRSPRQPFLKMLARSYRAAQKSGVLGMNGAPLHLAQDTAAFMQGVLTTWLVDDGSPAATRRSRRMIRLHIKMRRA